MPFLGTRGAGSNRAFGYAGAAKPNQVTGLTATDFGTSRAFNNGRIDLSWTEPGNNGATISGYKIERSTDNSTYSTLVANTGTSATTYSDTSLTSSQIYYYKVSAINAAGTSDASTASSATATTVPQAPTIGSATAGVNGASTIAYTAGATGGKAVSVFTATSSPGSLTGTGASPITVSGLTNGTAYTFTVTATNANGTSSASAASNSVTPVSAYVLQQTFTTNGNFTVPAGHTKLAIKGVGAGAGGGGYFQSVLGGWGGGSGMTFALTDVVTNGGTVYAVTIGAGGSGGSGAPSSGATGNNPGVGGITNFGNILTANGGAGFDKNAFSGYVNTAPAYNGEVNSNTGTRVTGTGGRGGKGGANNATGNGGQGQTGFAAATAMNSATSADAYVGTVTGGGGGGGGGAGASNNSNNVGGNYTGQGGFAGGSNVGATGGNGGNAPLGGSGTAGNAGGSASVYGGGGGGGGASGYTPLANPSGGPGAGGSGSQAIIYVYTKP